MPQGERNLFFISPLPPSWKGFMEDIPPLSDDFSVEGAELPNDLPRAALTGRGTDNRF